MKELNLQQGSQAWLDNRRTARGASEAPVVMGASKYQKRSDLIKQKATGIVPEVDPATQRLFDRGHETEAKARVIIEAITGKMFVPLVCTSDDGYLTASFDGIDVGEDFVEIIGSTCFEHKLKSASLVEQVKAKLLEPHYYWQLEQQLHVSGAEKVIFAVSDGTEESLVWMEYRAVPGRIEQLIAGWKQFDQDVAAYQPEKAAAPVVGEAVQDLPAVYVQVTGSVSVADNFAAFGEALRDFIENKLIRKPQTDQEFANLESQIKSLKKAEDALDAAEAQMIAQVSSVDSMKRAKEMLHKMARDNRLLAEKLVKTEKENRKSEIVTGAQVELANYVSALVARIGVSAIRINGGVFAEAIKGLKSLDSMRDKVASALANEKVAASMTADLIDANRKSLDDMSLAPDFAQICTKSPDDFAALISMRLNLRKEAEQKRLDAERERIRAEEQIKAQREVAEKAAAEKREADAKAAAEKAEQDRIAAEEIRKLDAERKAVTKTPDPVPEIIAEPVVVGKVSIGEGVTTEYRIGLVENTEKAAANTEEVETVKLGEICAMLGFSVTADFLASIGHHPVGTERSAKLYKKSSVSGIFSSLVKHIAAKTKSSAPLACPHCSGLLVSVHGVLVEYKKDAA